MAQNITLLGASYQAVPAVKLPKTGGGTAQFDDTTDANATAGDIASGKTAYVNGVKLTGTASGGTAAISVVDTTDAAGGIIREITALDISDTTAVAADVAAGKYFYTADGTKTEGTASGGGGGGQFPSSFTIKKNLSTSGQCLLSRPIIDTSTGDIRMQTLVLSNDYQTVELSGTKYATPIWAPVITVQFNQPLSFSGNTLGVVGSTTYVSGSTTLYLYYVAVKNGDAITVLNG